MYEVNDDWTTLPDKRVCPKCEGDMRLRVLENTSNEIAYTYFCDWKKCGYTYDILGAE